MSDKVAIGIDLGTTYCCVAVFQDGKLHTCLNAEGQKTTPSYVCYTKTDRLVGQVAKQQSVMYHHSTVYDAKRLIGRSFEDNAFNDDLTRWPFKVVNDKGKLKIQIQVIDKVIDDKKGEFEFKEMNILPEEISKILLEKMKEYAEEYLQYKVDKAVITVPARFTDKQRRATEWAAKEAGLNVLRIVNEPTAAAYAYGIKNQEEKNLLVFDLGGGTFDVTILTICKLKVKVVVVLGDNHLGGQDFDNNLAKFCLKIFKTQKNIDLENEKTPESEKAIQRLLKACEKVKITLSNANETPIAIDCFYKQIDFNYSLARARFESLNAKEFEKCFKIVDECLMEAEKKNIKKENLEIVLVGGSTKIPKVKNDLKKKFSGNKIHENINADEAVAHGAAILANIFINSKNKGIQDDSLRDIIPLSLGVESFGGVMSVMLPKYTEIPKKITKVYSNVEDNQESILISIYEGERMMVEDNSLLDEFEITDIPLGQKGTVKIDVTFEIDINSILRVSAVEKSKGVSKTIIVARANKISKEEMDRILEEEIKYKAQDTKKRETIIAKNKLISYVESMKNEIKSKVNKDKLLPDQLSKLEEMYNEALDYCDFGIDNNETDYIEKKQILADTFMIMIRMNSNDIE